MGVQFEVNKHYYDSTYWIHHSCAVFSDDGGYTGVTRLLLPIHKPFTIGISVYPLISMEV